MLKKIEKSVSLIKFLNKKENKQSKQLVHTQKSLAGVYTYEYTNLRT